MLVDFKNSFTFGFSQKFAMKALSFSPSHFDYVAMLLSKM